MRVVKIGEGYEKEDDCEKRGYERRSFRARGWLQQRS